MKTLSVTTLKYTNNFLQELLSISIIIANSKANKIKYRGRLIPCIQPYISETHLELHPIIIMIHLKKNHLHHLYTIAPVVFLSCTFRIPD